MGKRKSKIHSSKMGTTDKKEKEDVKAEETKEVKEEKKDPATLTLEDVREHCRLLERSVVSKESRFAVRVLRGLPATRKKLTGNIMKRLITGFYTHSAAEREALLAYIPDDSMETDADVPVVNVRLRGAKSANTPLPEVDCYLQLLILLFLMDAGKKEDSVKISDALVDKLASQNRRSLDHVAGRCYFYHTLSHEAVGQLAQIRGFLHARLKHATLHNDFEGQGVLINCLLRNYLHYNLYDHANKLVLKETFPEQVSNSEWARYLYYLGRIKAIQLDYS